MIPISPLLFLYYVFNHKSAREKRGEELSAKKARRRRKWNLETPGEKKGDRDLFRRMMNEVNDKNMAKLYSKKKRLLERLNRIDSADSGEVTWQQFWAVVKNLNHGGEQFQQKALDQKSTIALTQMQQLAQIQHLAEHRNTSGGQATKKNAHERRQWAKIKNAVNSNKHWAEFL